MAGVVRHRLITPPLAVIRVPSSGWGLVALGAACIVVATAIAAATGVLPEEAAVRAALRGASSVRMRQLVRTIRPLGTWWGLVPGLVLLLATSRHARQRWWLWGTVLIAAALAGEALRELVGRLRPRGSPPSFRAGTRQP